MNSIKNLISLALTLIFAIIFTACGGQDQISDTKEGVCTPEPSKVLLMHKDWQEAETIRRVRYHEVEEMEKECRKYTPNRDCDSDAEYQRDQVFHHYTVLINRRPLRQCQASILWYDEETNEFDINEEDTDGDGVSNYQEYQMGTDPCSKHTFPEGQCKEDGEYDFDGDGIPNQDDDRPLCNFDQVSPFEMDTPEHDSYVFASDCV